MLILSAVLRKVEFQSDFAVVDILPVDALFFILAADVFGVFPCIFVKVWELGFKLRSKRHRYCTEQV